MMEAIVFTLKLLIVKDIQTNPDGSTLLFEEGQKGNLLSNHNRYDYYLVLAQRSLERKHPVGVTLAAPDKIVEMARADNDIATQLTDDGTERIKVWFQGHNGTFFLERNHPDFARLITMLNQSIKKKTRVWFVAKLPLLILEDIAEFVP